MNRSQRRVSVTPVQHTAGMVLADAGGHPQWTH